MTKNIHSSGYENSISNAHKFSSKSANSSNLYSSYSLGAKSIMSDNKIGTKAGMKTGLSRVTGPTM